uniref:Uncharacterized protein n=1 Tax=Arundo donax TaxID=35708 RepID=A0A0A9DR05_ARUDO
MFSFSENENQTMKHVPKHHDVHTQMENTTEEMLESQY